MSDIRTKLVLASGSPRRLALLEQVGITPDLLVPTAVDETPKLTEMPRTLVKRLARAKAQKAAESHQVAAMEGGTYILSADTIVAIGRRIIGKPKTIEEAAIFLQKLSGRSHRVFTSVCLVTPGGNYRQRTVETRVRFKRLSKQDLEGYLTFGEWRDKAGAYAIQGRAEAFVQKITGSYSNVVGLPLNETIALLHGSGYPVYFNWFSVS
jgi:nucleoside triphosphate pyrophosphatase